MAIRSLKSGSFSRSTQVGNSIILPGDYESIATVSVGVGGTSSVTFSSIPSTYKHLQIRALQRDTQTTSQINSLYITFNGIGGTSYSWHRMEGFGSGTPTSGGATSQGNIWIGPSSTNGYNANIFTAHIIDILDYANTNKYKTVRHLGGFDTNGTGTEPGDVALTSGLFMDTTAISSITISKSGQNQTESSHFALYGIRG